MPPNTNEAQPNTPAPAEQAATPAAPAAVEAPTTPAPPPRDNPDAPPSSRYSVPEAGNQPPQTVLEQRDLAQRDRRMLEYRRLEQRELGRAAALQTEAGDREFYEDGYDARTRVLHEPDAVLDEHQRLQEINAIYLDQCLENFVERINLTEQSRSEAKYGRGTIGCVRRWMHETDIGKGVSVLGKGGLAAGIVALTSHNFLAPAGLLAAKKLGTDAILETVQYGFERPVLQCLNGLRQERHNIMMELMQLRNQIANRDNDHQLAPNQQQANINGNNVALHDSMERIITEFDRIETELLQREERLALIRTIGKSVRTVASIAWSASAIYNIFEHGLMLNLDALADPTHAVGHMDASAAAHHIVGSGTSPEVFHNVKVASDGMRFVYETGEQLTNGLSAIGGETHLLAGAAATQAGLAAGALGAVAVADISFMVNDAIRSNRMRGRMHDVLESPLEERNLDDQAVFTVTGRTALGPSSGVTHEISNLSGLSRDRDIHREQLELKKENFTVGKIFRVPAHLIGTGLNVALPPFALNRPDIYIQVVGWTEDMSGRKKNLRYVIFDADSEQELTTNHRLIVNSPGTDLREEANADNIIDQAEQVADNYSQFRARRTPRANQDRAREELGQPEVAPNSNWRANTNFALNHSGGQSMIQNGDILRINSLSPDGSRAVVSVRNANNQEREVIAGVDLTPVLRNCVVADLGAERQNRLQATLDNVNNFLRAQGMPMRMSFADKMIFHHRDAAGNANWIAITGFNSETGDITFKECDYDPATSDIQTGPALKRELQRPAPQHADLQTFEARFGAVDANNNYIEELRHDTRRTP